MSPAYLYLYISLLWQRIREKIPADPLEAELLQMAQAVAGGDDESDSDTDHSDLDDKVEPLEGNISPDLKSILSLLDTYTDLLG